MVEFKNKVELITENGRHDYVNSKGEIINKPSVTALINLIYPFPEDIPEDILLKAQERGTCVHKRMEDYANLGTIGKCNHLIDTHDKLFLIAKNCFDTIKQQFGIKEFYTELALEGDFYLGCIDLVFKDKNDKWVILDYKTTNHRYFKTDQQKNKQFLKEATQLELYSNMLPFEISKHIIINPNKTKYHIYSVDSFGKYAKINIEKIKEKLNEQERN